jgi:hypothetical protein
MVKRLAWRLGPDRRLRREGERRAALCQGLSVLDKQEVAVVQNEPVIVDPCRLDCVSRAL